MQYNANSILSTVYLPDLNIPDETPIKIMSKPESYRKFFNQERGYIRLTGTYIYQHWVNNLYISDDNTVPANGNYWMFGDFVVKKNNINID